MKNFLSNPNELCLITTADEKSWLFDRPVIFLGGWCCRHARQDLWRSMNAFVAPPYGLDLESRDRDNQLAREYENSLFPELCKILNQYHSTDHTQRYWSILIGHWFRRYIEVIINRYQTLNKCIEVYQPSEVAVSSQKRCELAPWDSYAAIWKFNDDDWNSSLYVRLAEQLNISRVSVEPCNLIETKEVAKNTTSLSGNFLGQLFKSALSKCLKWSVYLSRNEDAVIINSYLPRKFELLLNLSLRQIPFRYKEQRLSFPVAQVDHFERHRLSKEITPPIQSGLNYSLRSLIFELMPICFLEGYSGLVKAASNLSWPKNPKFIFTSNNFDTDEIFKVWTAEKVESGIPYFVGQHGSNYGTSRYMNPSIEELTSDKFITWGWSDGLSQHVPGFIFKTCGNKRLKSKKNGGLLLIELHPGQMLTTWDSVAEYGLYFNEQLRFVESLWPTVRKALIVRLQLTLQDLGWNEISRWQEFDPFIKLETGAGKLEGLICDSRLVVFSYNSTGVLECMSQNIPMIAFWQNGLEEIRDSAKPYFQLLVDAHILHANPQSAAEHINTIWNNVEEWWNSSSVQDARLKFCQRYAASCLRPVSEMKKILMRGM